MECLWVCVFYLLNVVTYCIIPNMLYLFRPRSNWNTRKKQALQRSGLGQSSNVKQKYGMLDTDSLFALHGPSMEPSKSVSRNFNVQKARCSPSIRQMFTIQARQHVSAYENI